MTLVTIIVVVTAALLTSSLVNAKIALQQATTRHITVALARGTDELTNWAQRYVAQNSASATWPTTTQSDTPRQICNDRSSAAACPLNETTTYAVVGSTIGSARTGPDTAENLQLAVHENRIAAVVTVTIKNRSRDVVGIRSRELTLRVFDASPFAVVTGTRDINSALGASMATQGDTAGYSDPRILVDRKDPTLTRLGKYRDTRLRVNITCSNSAENNDQTDPSKDNHSPGNDDKPFGTSDPAYEAPCVPTYTPDPKHPAPPGAADTKGTSYDMSSESKQTPWTANASTRSASWTQ